MPFPILGAIALGAAGLGSVLSSKSANKAANKAADTSLQVAQQNNALARENRDFFFRQAQPTIDRGNTAGGALNAMLGLAPAQQPQQAFQQPNALMNYYSGDNPAGMPSGMSWQDQRGIPSQFRNALLDAYPELGGMQPQGYAQPQAMGTPQTLPTNGMDPFRQFIMNSDYGFQFGEGANRINSGYAGAGTLQSGAAMKDLERFRQNLQSGYRGEFMDRLTNQQGAGLSALGAGAGVGINFVNQASANNNAAGTAVANAALAKGANNPWANALSLIGGGALGFLS